MTFFGLYFIIYVSVYVCIYVWMNMLCIDEWIYALAAEACYLYSEKHHLYTHTYSPLSLLHDFLLFEL